MNSLSWLLYWAAVCDNIGGSFGFITVLWGVAFLPMTGVYIFIGYLASCGSEADKTEATAALPFTKHLWRINIAGFLGFMVAFAIVPDKKTIYAIAASEVGEQVVKSKDVQGVASDAAKALQAWIKQQIEPTAKAEKK